MTEISETSTSIKTWEPFDEDIIKTFNDGGSVDLTLHGMRRIDGLEILREGGDREGVETFIIRWHFGEIRIIAHRGGCWVQMFPSSTYIIEVNFSPKRWPGDHSNYPSIILQYAEDLADALFHFNPPAFKNIGPVKEVWLNKGNGNVSKFEKVGVRETPILIN